MILLISSLSVAEIAFSATVAYRTGMAVDGFVAVAYLAHLGTVATTADGYFFVIMATIADRRAAVVFLIDFTGAYIESYG